jgi:hypothetical protein
MKVKSVFFLAWISLIFLLFSKVTIEIDTMAASAKHAFWLVKHPMYPEKPKHVHHFSARGAVDVITATPNAITMIPNPFLMLPRLQIADN